MSLEKKTLLLVDDDAIIAFNQATSLKDAGYTVEIACSGQEAVDRVSMEDIDLVLMDIDLGQGMDGTDAAREILKSCEIPIVFVSSHTEKDIVRKTETITSYGYVVKSAGITVLDASIKMAFRLHEARSNVVAKNMEIEAANEELQATIEELEKTNEELIHSQKEIIARDAALSDAKQNMDSFLQNAKGFSVYRTTINKDLPWGGRVEFVSPSLTDLTGITDLKNFTTWFDDIHPDDIERVAEANIRSVEKGVPYDELIRWYHKLRGEWIWGRTIANPILDENGTIRHFNGLCIDMTDAMATQKMFEIERDLGIALTTVSTLNDALMLCLEASIKAAIMDSGGIYIRNDDGSLDLHVHRGLTDEFVRAGSHYEADTDNARIVENGKPLYMEDRNTGLDLDKMRDTEGLKSAAILPVLFGGKVVACMNVSSHTAVKIPHYARFALEDITSRLGSTVIGFREEQARQKSEALYHDLVNNQSVGIYRIRVRKNQPWGSPDQSPYFYEFMNDRYCQLTGFSRGGFIADPSITLKQVHPDDKDDWVARNEQSMRMCKPFEWEGRMILKDEIRWMHFESRPRELPDGDIIFTGMLMDITERKNAEVKLRQSLADKDLLMHEVQHRVKNNLTLVASLINLEIAGIKDPSGRKIFQNTIDRIRSISGIYDQLNRTSEFANVNIKMYIGDLLSTLLESYETNPGRIRLSIEVDDFDLNLEQAVPVGIIVNELFTNSLKHAYPPPSTGEIRLRLSKTDNDVALFFEDDGPGIPRQMLNNAPERMGLRLIELLVKQIGGTLEIQSLKGTMVIIKFRKKLPLPHNI